MAARAESVAAVTTRKPASWKPRASHIGLWLALFAIVAGFLLPTERYITPQDGFGYWLGIVGGSLMLALLIYPMRKRMPKLAVIGSVRFWFRTHMVLGVVGPLAILYHANFSLGATNSNVALVCMLIVAGSGLVGRYLYARIHHGLYGQKATLRELTADAESLRTHSGTLKVLPGLMDEVERAEREIARPAPMVVRPVLAAIRERRESHRIRRLVRDAVAMAATRSSALQQERVRFTRTASDYVSARLRAARRVAEFEASERLFAIWHVLHMPLFVVLVIVGIVHVIAVNVY
ncbi:MAG TPA: hypothetical protein VFO31_23070 [Vicinamibacterales bacterium]|nr:hypothetical protein [Vicinamibacterales bacterium]